MSKLIVIFAIALQCCVSTVPAIKVPPGTITRKPDHEPRQIITHKPKPVERYVPLVMGFGIAVWYMSVNDSNQ